LAPGQRPALMVRLMKLDLIFMELVEKQSLKKTGSRFKRVNSRIMSSMGMEDQLSFIKMDIFPRIQVGGIMVTNMDGEPMSCRTVLLMKVISFGMILMSTHVTLVKLREQIFMKHLY